MTLRLYYDSDTLSFDASVVGHDGKETRVVLDRTAFYPTSGGQPHDIGTLGTARVIDVIDGDERIIHVVDAPLPLGPIHGEVDAIRRRDYTVQHTAQHLISALAADRFGWNTASVHFGAAHSTIEFDATSANREQLDRLEEWSNDAIGAALAVGSGFEDAAAARGLRKPTDRTGSIRVVTIEDLDRSACGGTHVTSTARIGSVCITTSEKIRGRVRVGFLAGGRVLARLRECDSVLVRLAETSGAGVDELAELIPVRLDALRQMEKRVDTLERESARYRLRELLADAESGPDGVRRVILHPGTGPIDTVRRMAQAVAEESRVVFIATGDSPATIVLAVSADSGINAGNLLKEALVETGGRGGGSQTMAQGTVPDSAVLDMVVKLVSK